MLSPPPSPRPNRYRSAHRLSGRRAYQRVFRDGKRFHARGVMIVARANGIQPMRLGLSVGRRVGNAIVRSRVKRRMRDAFRRAPSRRLGGLDIVVVLRDATAFASLSDLDARIERILRDAHRRLVERAQGSR